MMTNEKTEGPVKILAFETSSHVASVAAMEGDVLLGEFTINHPKTHSQKLMPMLEMLMGSLDLKIKDFDYLAVTSGPGSFTGVRIGVATVKALAQPHLIPVVAVSSLEAMAQNFSGFEGLICPMLDARKNEIYTALYKWEGDTVVEVEPDQAIHPEAWLEHLAALKVPVMITGDALPKYEASYRAHLGDLLHVAPPAYNRQRASAVAQSALGKLETAVPYHSVPTEYLRKSEAETTYDAKHGIAEKK